MAEHKFRTIHRIQFAYKKCDRNIFSYPKPKPKPKYELLICKCLIVFMKRVPASASAATTNHATAISFPTRIAGKFGSIAACRRI